MKPFIALFLTVLMYLVYAGPVVAQNVPSGTISISEKEFGFIIGGSEGRGHSIIRGPSTFSRQAA